MLPTNTTQLAMDKGSVDVQTAVNVIWVWLGLGRPTAWHVGVARSRVLL